MGEFTKLESFEGLLSPDADKKVEKKWKKYVKAVLPHVALVAVVAVYAVGGAVVFYLIESPHEHKVRNAGVAVVIESRQKAIQSMWQRSPKGASKGITKEQWMQMAEAELNAFSSDVYTAFETQLVRHSDYSAAAKRRRSPRSTQARSTQDDPDNLWSWSSSLFFASTTMATIGYGNIVPVTPEGRAICVLFSLLGAPLAIITIGDMGKFLSTGTIWLYKRLQDVGDQLTSLKNRLCARTGLLASDSMNDVKRTPKKKRLAIDELIKKDDVPVALVFSILIIYIAVGAVLFSFVEEWTYLDSFYFCFITLTTVGFGDLVPAQHDYIILMLLYIGIGLAVTTMCIDLVGTKYIQKIHYFGRKFKGTDFLQYLKRRKLLEEKLAMGQGEEVLQLYLETLHLDSTPDDDWMDVETIIAKTPEESKEEVVLVDACPVEEPPPLPPPTPIPEIPPTPSPISLHSSCDFRTLMYHQRTLRVSSRSPSGPDVWSTTTSPSVHERQRMYAAEGRTNNSSVLSFHFDYPPSPAASSDDLDMEAVAKEAKSSRSVGSCPGHYVTLPPSPIGLSCMENWESYVQMLDESERTWVKPPETPVAESSSSSEEEAESDAVPQIMIADNYCFILDGARLKQTDIMADEHWWRHTSRPTKFYHSRDLSDFQRVNCIQAKGRVISAKLPTQNDWNTRIVGKLQQAAAEGGSGMSSSLNTPAVSRRPSMSRGSVSVSRQGSIASDIGGMAEHTEIDVRHVYKVMRFYSFWKTCTSFHRIVTMIMAANERETPFKKRIFVQYLWRNAKEHEKARVQKEFDPKKQRLIKFVTDATDYERLQLDPCGAVNLGNLCQVPHRKKHSTRSVPATSHTNP